MTVMQFSVQSGMDPEYSGHRNGSGIFRVPNRKIHVHVGIDPEWIRNGSGIGPEYSGLPEWSGMKVFAPSSESVRNGPEYSELAGIFRVWPAGIFRAGRNS